MSWILGCIPELPFFTQSLTSSIWVQPCVSWGHTSVQAPNAAWAGPQQFNKILIDGNRDSITLPRYVVTPPAGNCWQPALFRTVAMAAEIKHQQTWSYTKVMGQHCSETCIIHDFLYCLNTKNRLRIFNRSAWWAAKLWRPDHASHEIMVFQSEAEAKLLILAVEDSEAHSPFSGFSLSIKKGELSWTPWSHTGKKMSRFLYVPCQG